MALLPKVGLFCFKVANFFKLVCISLVLNLLMLSNENGLLFNLLEQIIAGDPESVTETWMSNVYSFGMVVWEMVTGEAAYSTYSPVQAAVGIAAWGLRPDIPKDCPQILRSLMVKCWNNCPSKRPPFSEILRLLQRSSYNNTR